MSKGAILEAFNKVTKEGGSVWVSKYDKERSTKTPTKHQFVFFIKPEATASYKGVDVSAVLDLVLEALKTHKVEIGAVRVVGGDYLDKHNVMSDHYGVIAKISKEGQSALSETAVTNLKKIFAEELKAGVKVQGGHQFLNENKDFNAVSLVTLNDNLGTKRLAGGSYAMKVSVLGQKYILLNPFHAYQLVPYTTKGHAIIVLEGLTDAHSWEHLRNKIAGVTDPKAAEKGSVRNVLLENQSATKMEEVSKGNNGVHMSAGPLEGMVEFPRFFSDLENGTMGYEDTCFGALLKQKKVSDENLKKLADNPDFEVDGKMISAFDLTEEKDSSESADLLISKL